jgi:uncharacterized protein (DUF433 family)
MTPVTALWRELFMTLPEFLRQTSAGEIRLAGHRIGLLHLVRYYNEGYSAEMLACQYPTLALPLIHKVIAFYLENQAEVDAYVARCQEELARQREANPRRLDLAALRQRLAARQRQEAPAEAESR